MNLDQISSLKKQKKLQFVFSTKIICFKLEKNNYMFTFKIVFDMLKLINLEFISIFTSKNFLINTMLKKKIIPSYFRTK